MTDLERLDVGDEVVKEGFSVTDLTSAEWCMRMKGRAQTEIDRFTAMAEKLKAEYCAQVDARLEEIIGPHDRTMAVMTDFMRPWADVEIAKSGKRSVKLISGTVGFRASPASLEVHDEAAAVAWLKEHAPDCVRVKEEVKKAETKKLIEATGELPDGTALVPGSVNFYAEPLSPALENKHES